MNISSVICPNELLTRPFVFRDTNAEPMYWLMPHEVAAEVEKLISSNHLGCFAECELYHPACYNDEHYYDDQPFTVRKKRELGIAPHA